VITKIDFESKVALTQFEEDKRQNRLNSMDAKDKLTMETLLNKRSVKEQKNNQVMINSKDGKVVV